MLWSLQNCTKFCTNDSQIELFAPPHPLSSIIVLNESAVELWRCLKKCLVPMLLLINRYRAMFDGYTGIFYITSWQINMDTKLIVQTCCHYFQHYITSLLMQSKYRNLFPKYVWMSKQTKRTITCRCYFAITNPRNYS